MPKDLKYDLTLLLVIVIWGANFPILKQVLETMHPFVVNALRFTVSIITIGSILVLSKDARASFGISVFKKNIYTLISVGLLGYFLYQVFFILGIENTTAGNSALLMASSPAWTAVAGVLFIGEQLTGRAWAGLVTSLIGAVLIVFSGTNTIQLSSDYHLGNILIIFAAICWGAYTAFSHPATKRINPISFTLFGLLLSFPFNVFCALPHYQEVSWEVVTLGTWLAIIYSGGLSTGIAVVLWIFVVKKVGATHTAVFGNLVPVVALIGSVIILDEIITIVQLVGGAVILCGIFLMRSGRA